MTLVPADQILDREDHSFPLAVVDQNSLGQTGLNMKKENTNLI